MMKLFKVNKEEKVNFDNIYYNKSDKKSMTYKIGIKHGRVYVFDIYFVIVNKTLNTAPVINMVFYVKYVSSDSYPYIDDSVCVTKSCKQYTDINSNFLITYNVDKHHFNLSYSIKDTNYSEIVTQIKLEKIKL